MAKYISGKGDTELSICCSSLELDGWIIPEYWEGDERSHPGWPNSAVNALIHLFTGDNANDHENEGIEIPDMLGWHIAALAEIYAGHDTGAILDPHTRESTEIWGEEAWRLRRTIIEINQRWYRDGIALYAQTREK